MSLDHYAGAAHHWAEGASLVYGPIARQLIEASPHHLAGHAVLDVGSGTGVASTALGSVGARPIAADLSYDMVAWCSWRRPPAVVGDVCSLPFASRSLDDTVAAFVLNHLSEPATGLAEAMRVTRPGGSLLACVYGNASRSEVRNTIDRAAQREGWVVPDWYLDMKRRVTPILGTVEAMERAARQAGLVEVVVDERPVDVGVSEPEQLVGYRLGQAHFASWLDQLGPTRAEEMGARIVEQIRPIMVPYRPIVVFLTAVTPTP